MIARIIIPLILLIVLPQLYLDLHYLRRRIRYTWWKRLLYWLPSLLMLLYTVCLACVRSFVPEQIVWMEVYLFLLGLITIPRALFVLCSLIARFFCYLRHSRANWGNLVGLVVGLFAIYILLYGVTIGFRKLNIRHVDVYSEELPAAFDRYRIVQFSDAHVGTYRGSRQWILQKAIDSINAQHADMVVFTGDLQNIQPQELYEHRQLLSGIWAKDGVFSVLGNHDYSQYVNGDDIIKAANERETIGLERQFGWRLLLNEHQSIRRGKDSIVIAGEENDGNPPFPQKGDIRKTLEGVPSGTFIIMLQHDPSAWRRSILPESEVQLTLSGHTHGGQFSLFGWRPTRLTNTEDYGLYQDGDRYLHVSGGLGGVIPFRFGLPGEIVVITLHKKKTP